MSHKTVRIVAIGEDNGTLLAVVKTYSVEGEPGELPEDIVERARAAVQRDLRDWLQDGLEVALSEVQVTAGLVT